MANLNPIATIRDVDSTSTSTRQVHEVVGRISCGGAHTVTVETRLKSILSAIVVNETDGAVVIPTISDSTVVLGTKRVSFTGASGKTYSYKIVGLLNRIATVDTTSGATTVNYYPLSQR